MFLIVPCLTTRSFNGIAGDANGLIEVEDIHEALAPTKNGDKLPISTRRRVIPDTSMVELTQNDAEFDYEIIDVLLSTNDVDEELIEILSDEVEPFSIRPYDEYDKMADRHNVDHILNEEDRPVSFFDGMDFDSYEDDYVADELESMTLSKLDDFDSYLKWNDEELIESDITWLEIEDARENSALDYEDSLVISLYRPRTRHRVAANPGNVSLFTEIRKDRTWSGRRGRTPKPFEFPRRQARLYR